MRKIIFLTSLLFILQSTTTLKAQLEDNENVVFNAHLGGAFDLIVVPGGELQTATFNAASDYEFGISETIGVPGIDPGFTTVQMVATGDWYLNISAPDFMPMGTEIGFIPINNLGVYCEATGVHQFGTEVTCAYQSADAALGLSNTDVRLIDVGTGNTGGQVDNEFILHWIMGTMQGSMEPTSMFVQLAAEIFGMGNYTTTVVLTMTEIP
jgi:hypothetical protein